MVSIPRCGRGDPRSNPGRGRVTETQSKVAGGSFFARPKKTQKKTHKKYKNQSKIKDTASVVQW